MALRPCAECGKAISDKALACPNCGAPTGRATPAAPVAYLGGYDYRSSARLFGLPLLHVAGGYDPATGRKRVAKGIVAVGDVAIGVLAVGGAAFGGVALGGFTLGVAALGGAAFGVALGIGGLATGWIAAGGLAIGHYALGGAAFGSHALGGNVQDPEAIEFFRRLWPS